MGAPRKYDWAKVTNLAQSGMNVEGISESLGIPRKAINHILLKQGVKAGKPFPHSSKLSKEEVLERIRKDGRYEPADDFEYIDNKIPFNLICKKHGLISISLGNLCYKDGTPKKGCQDCYDDRRSILQRLPVEEVLHRLRMDGRFTPAEDFHYVNNRKTIFLICPKPGHGRFPTLFSNVCDPKGKSKKHACKKCANEAKALAKLTPSNGQSLLDRFPVVASWWAPSNEDGPGDVYAHSNYKRNFICPDCGKENDGVVVGSIVSGYVKRGKYCRYCSESGFKREKEGTIYVLKLETDVRNFYKAGITNHTVDERFRRISRSAKNVYKTCNISILKDWHFAYGGHAEDIEWEILLGDNRYYPGRKFEGYTECYEEDPTGSIIDIIERYNLTEEIV